MEVYSSIVYSTNTFLVKRKSAYNFKVDTMNKVSKDNMYKRPLTSKYIYAHINEFYKAELI